MANNKRKGRTRIKLDAKKIALAKQLILREATTTVIANELNISRTFAWRLRKSLVNGVSLHERVIDPPEEEEEDNEMISNANQQLDNGETLNLEKPIENQLNHQPFTEHIKTECPATEDEEDNEEFEDGQQQQHHQQRQQLLRQHNSVATSVIQRTNELKQHNAQQQLSLTTTSSLSSLATTKAIIEQHQQQQQHKMHNNTTTISVVQQQRLMELHTNSSNHHNSHPDNKIETGTESDSEIDDNDYHQQQQLQQHQETELVNSQQQKIYLQKTNLRDQDDAQSNDALPLMTQLAPAVQAAM